MLFQQHLLTIEIFANWPSSCSNLKETTTMMTVFLKKNIIWQLFTWPFFYILYYTTMMMMPLFQKWKEYGTGIFVTCPYDHQTVFDIFADFYFRCFIVVERKLWVTHANVDVYQKMVSCVYLHWNSFKLKEKSLFCFLFFKLNNSSAEFNYFLKKLTGHIE